MTEFIIISALAGITALVLSWIVRFAKETGNSQPAPEPTPSDTLTEYHLAGYGFQRINFLVSWADYRLHHVLITSGDMQINDGGYVMETKGGDEPIDTVADLKRIYARETGNKLYWSTPISKKLIINVRNSLGIRELVYMPGKK